MKIEIPKEAVKIQPIRIKNGELVKYSIIGWKTKSNQIIKMWVNRMNMFDPEKREDNCMIDFLDSDNSIIGDLEINSKQFNYLRRSLKFRVVQ